MLSLVFKKMQATQSSQSVLDAFLETGAYLKGHFRLTSGLHSPEYLQCAKVLQHPGLAERFGVALVFRFGKVFHGQFSL